MIELPFAGANPVLKKNPRSHNNG